MQRSRWIIAATALILALAVSIYVMLGFRLTGGEKPASPLREHDSPAAESTVKLRQKSLAEKNEAIQPTGAEAKAPALLDKLDLSGPQTTDAELAQRLEGLTSLRELTLQDANITDAGLLHLKGLTNLHRLDLGKTQLTDAGLVQLAALTNLKELNLSWTEVTDAGLVHLAGLENLEWLNLYGTKVTDAGLAHLKNMTKLQTLCLSHTLITDAGLAHLKDLTSLRYLQVPGTRVTKAGLAKLTQALPNCRFLVGTLKQSPLVGKTAPSFTLQDLHGKQVSLSEFKGKVVLLDFWATWCGPCVKAIPHLEALHKKYKDQGLAVIGINHERDHAKVKAFAKERISYVVLLGADKPFKEYGIRGIPTLFYIDRQGKVCHRDVGFNDGKEEAIERKVKELLRS